MEGSARICAHLRQSAFLLLLWQYPRASAFIRG
jgi:hypothetical protein